MMTTAHIPVVAIDGGGTRCRVAFRDGSGDDRITLGSANVSTDFDGAVREILAGVSALAERRGLRAQSARDWPAFIGLAGVTGSAIETRLRTALPFRDMCIRDDRPAALRGALGPFDGAVAHCGTGSFFAAQFGNDMRFAGGWGPEVGDEASAQWIGRTALRLTLRSVDGRGEATALATRLLSDLDGPAGIVRFAGSAGPAAFGALAPLVTDHARLGDAMALAVMREGASEIAGSLPGVGWSNGIPICLTGGVGPLFADYLPDAMRRDLKPPQGEPLDGALSLAQDFATEIAHERC